MLRGRWPAGALWFAFIAGPLCEAPCSLCAGSTVDEGRELIGVVAGEAFGEDAPLPRPTRDLRDEVRGVMLVPRNDLAGVVASSLMGAASRGVAPLALRTVRLVCDVLLAGVEGARARRGVRGVFAERLLASVGFKGRGLFGVDRSMGILQAGVRC